MVNLNWQFGLNTMYSFDKEMEFINEDFPQSFANVLASSLDQETSPYPQGNKDLLKPFHCVDHETTWRSKTADSWDEKDVRTWILDTAATKKINIVELNLSQFNAIKGCDLIHMLPEEFCERMHSLNDISGSRRVAEIIYEELQNKIAELPYLERIDRDYLSIENHEILDLDKPYNYIEQNEYSELDDSHSEGYENQNPEGDMFSFDNSGYLDVPEQSNVVIGKRPPGRPKGSGKKHPKRVKNVSVPEFLRDLLQDPDYCPSIIRWENFSEGKFRFVKADMVAKLWGGKRNNEKMSFEKFSRAMRYHYKQKVLVSVPGVRLVYQFGPKAPTFSNSSPIINPNST